MFQNLIDWGQNLTGRAYFSLALIAAALGIAAAVWLSNGAGTEAAECPVNTQAAQALDADAHGLLAGLQATGTGRGYEDLSFLDDTGRPLTLSDFKGKALLVNFWATWCVPCREEMPALNNLSASMDPEIFKVVPINLDLGEDGVGKAQKFMDQMDLPNLPLLADPSFAAFDRLKKNGVAIGLPATLLLDANGCELAVLQGPAEWDSDQGRKVIQTLIAHAGTVDAKA